MTMAETGKPQIVSTDPEHISISKSKGVKIDWKDGHTSDYSLRYLRHHCPCALCTGAHGTRPEAPPLEPSPFQLYQPALRVNGVQPVGNYAVRLSWHDGHARAI